MNSGTHADTSFRPSHDGPASQGDMGGRNAPPATLDLFLAGVGGVGGAFLDQLRAVASRLEGSDGVRIRLLGVADSRRAAIDTGGIPLPGWRDRLDGSNTDPNQLATAAAQQESERGGLRVLVDCTASPTVASMHAAVLRSGAAVVTANKIPVAGALRNYRELTKVGGHRYRYETTVGAALPVLRTLRDLRRTGDRVRRIDAVLSGTLAFVCSRLMEGASLADAVREAKRAGYTEPDPRIDLSGLDVVRKGVILARESGWDIEVEDVLAESLVPDALPAGGGSVQDFLTGLRDSGEELAGRAAQARKEGRWLVYLACLEGGSVRVGLDTVERGHPCHGLRGTDNVIAITSDRYPAPLVIRGAGAGREVTAAGVLSDVLSLSPCPPS